jgi:hypothetical protein
MNSKGEFKTAALGKLNELQEHREVDQYCNKETGR